MMDAAERAKQITAPMEKYLKQQEELYKHLSLISAGPVMPFVKNGVALEFEPEAASEQLTKKVLPVNPQVETNKLLRQLIESSEQSREEAAEDRLLFLQEFRRLAKENTYLHDRVAKLETGGEHKLQLQLQFQLLTKLVAIVNAMYHDLNMVAKFVQDTRTELGGPMLSNLPAIEDDGEEEMPSED
ncbi:MAG: hypothetical protein K2W82_13455 [Candidatus Obscuribacterales bacterium]|nr:hypothetical protein [Candidatus Obscuribacterales bacterium]